jgi:hypothetical protein
MAAQRVQGNQPVNQPPIPGMSIADWTRITVGAQLRSPILKAHTKANVGKFLMEYRAYKSRGGVLNIPQCLAFENTEQFRVTWQMGSQPLTDVEFNALTDDE